jgi:catechol O-methyltransferase
MPGMNSRLLVLGTLAALAVPCATFSCVPLAASVRSARQSTSLHLLMERDVGRREAVRQAATAAYGLASIAAFSSAKPVDAESNAAGRRVVPEDDMEFHMQWTYSRPQDILPYIFATAKKGSVDEILRAMDEFGRHYPMYKLGDEKGEILERELSRLQINSALELGTFLGYSALRTARHLSPNGILRCIEFNPDHAEVATKVVEYAGYSDRVQILIGDSSQVLKMLPRSIGKVDYVLLDHRKSLYLPDLQAMEKLGFVGKGTLVVADNVIYPGTPEYLEYVRTSSWETKLVDAKFEYDLWWKEGWSPKADALSFSRKLN